jgi:hypothetical protein
MFQNLWDFTYTVAKLGPPTASEVAKLNNICTGTVKTKTHEV